MRSYVLRLTPTKRNLKMIKEKLSKVSAFIFNPHFLLCFVFAWTITNGWAYVLAAAGAYFNIEWMRNVAGAYIAFLWLPISQEKILTLALSLAFLKFIFPDDTKTVSVLAELKNRTKSGKKPKQ